MKRAGSGQVPLGRMAVGKRTGGRQSARREGFALLAVLWVMVSVAALGLVAGLAGREAVSSARNRTELTRASWHAEDCLERARAVIAQVLSGASSPQSTSAAGWNSLHQYVASSSLLGERECHVTLSAAGSAIDVNAADAETLSALFLVLGIPAPRADSLSDAVLDWRDADDEPRANGAERAWYEHHERSLPRNGPIADLRELAQVRGFDAVSGLDSVLSVEPGRVSLAHAPLPVLAALPGFTLETVARVSERRLRDANAGDLFALAGELSPASREALLSRFSDLARTTTSEPDAWILTSRSSGINSALTAVIEVRLVRSASRAAIVRRRSWVS